jgi:hypothetical protein
MSESSESKAERSAADKAVEMFKIKKLIASLERARGCVPAGWAGCRRGRLCSEEAGKSALGLTCVVSFAPRPRDRSSRRGSALAVLPVPVCAAYHVYGLVALLGLSVLVRRRVALAGVGGRGGVQRV